jgi:hypothetical protein
LPSNPRLAEENSVFTIKTEGRERASWGCGDPIKLKAEHLTKAWAELDIYSTAFVGGAGDGIYLCVAVNLDGKLDVSARP